MMKIKAIITGTTGMVGKGVLYECFESPDVESVLVINRQPLGLQHSKLKEIIHNDFHDLSPLKEELKGYNACFFCMGISSVGLSEEKYHQVTHDITLHFAKVLLGLNPQMTFIYVSGTGTDSSEKGRMMWARVKGKTENAILAMPFKDAYMFRPGYIQPTRGIKSRTRIYNVFYFFLKPLYPLMKRLIPKYMTDTDLVGKAMINAVLKGYPKKHLENADINKLAK
jgi:hypothetical protein